MILDIIGNSVCDAIGESPLLDEYTIMNANRAWIIYLKPSLLVWIWNYLIRIHLKNREVRFLTESKLRKASEFWHLRGLNIVQCHSILISPADSTLA